MNIKSALAVGVAALSVNSACYAAADQSANDPLAAYEQQLGYQRKVILQEKAALDEAIRTRNNSVTLGKDMLDTLAYGVASGALTYDFLKGTNNVQAVRNLFASRNAQRLAPPVTPVESAAQVNLAAAESEATAIKATRQAETLRKVGTVAYRTTEAVSAAVLGVFFVGDLYNTGKDLTIRFSDTKEIEEHRAKLNEAERNLKVADQNLQVAVLANQN